jgi:hypothetical protein
LRDKRAGAAQRHECQYNQFPMNAARHVVSPARSAKVQSQGCYGRNLNRSSRKEKRFPGKLRQKISVSSPGGGDKK